MVMPYHGSFLLALSVLFLLPLSFPLTYAEGSSMSFPRQTITDSPDDGQFYPLFQTSNCTNIQRSIQMPEMTGVSYFSDGKSLNATIWLSPPFQEVPEPVVRFPLYSITIGIIQPYNMTVTTDYVTSLQWDFFNSTWIRSTKDFLGNDSRTLEQYNVDRVSFDNTGNRGKVDLNLDLQRISSSDQYLLIFSVFDATIEKGNACGFVDVTENAVQIPPPEFVTSTFPAPLEIRQGEEKTVELRINSTARNDAFVKLGVQQNSEQIPAGMDITIEPDETNMTADGVATSHINVKVSDQVTPTSYSPQISSTFFFPITIDVSSLINLLAEEASSVRSLAANANRNQNSSGGDVSDLGTEETLISAMSLTPRTSSFSIVVKPYPIEEQFRDFWNTYGGPISLIAGGFAAGFSALLIDRFRNRPRYKSKTVDDRS
jgi:hypothetical protein